MKLLYISVLAGSLASASVAHADDGALSSSSSSGSVSVSVYIPPLRAALAAAQEGAVGLWTISGRNNGLMIQLNAAALRGYESVSIYSRGEVGVVAEWTSGGHAKATEERWDMNGLNKSTFAVPRGNEAVRTIRIRGI